MKTIIPESFDSNFISNNDILYCGFNLFPKFNTNSQFYRSINSILKTIIQIIKLSSEIIFCRPQDLIEKKKNKNTITIDNLEFNIFIELIVRDLNYKTPKNIIIYQRVRAQEYTNYQ